MIFLNVDGNFAVFLSLSVIADVLLLGLDVQLNHIHYSTTHFTDKIENYNNNNVTSIKEYSLQSRSTPCFN